MHWAQPLRDNAFPGSVRKKKKSVSFGNPREVVVLFQPRQALLQLQFAPIITSAASVATLTMAPLSPDKALVVHFKKKSFL